MLESIFLFVNSVFLFFFFFGACLKSFSTCRWVAIETRRCFENHFNFTNKFGKESNRETRDF